MKKTLIIGALLAGTTGLFAQGTIVFSDFQSTFEIHIYAPQTDNPATQITGNASNDKPAGTQTAYNGGVVGGSGTGGGLGNGNNITVQLQAAGGGTSAAPISSLSGVSQYTTTVYTIAGGAGLFISKSPSPDAGIPNSEPSGTATVALAAWFNNGGLITSLSAAQSAGVAWGESAAVFMTGLGNPNGAPPTPAPALLGGASGIQSFNLTQSVPEPSTIALGVMGASSFLLRRRMKK